MSNAVYKARLSAPGASNKNYLHYTKGGYNYCILISGNSCLPNCVGYAWGRWRELLGARPKLSRGNAEDWWNYKDGYERGQTPKLGAVICWRKGKTGTSKDGAGHVAIVEQINSDGSIVTSNSGYSGTRFYKQTLKPPYNIGSAYTFQGFIYLPIDYEEERKTVQIEMQILRKGAKGAQVKTLQRLLLSLGYDLKGYGVDGSFGSATDAAVRAFQKDRGLVVDGSVGKATWSALLN